MLRFKKLRPDAIIPTYAHKGDAGMDLIAVEDAQWQPIFAVHCNASGQIIVGYKTMVKTGLAMSLPVGFEGMVRSKSGLAAKHNIFVTNSPGCIDSGYRGEIMVMLTCIGLPTVSKVVAKGTKVAQLVINKVESEMQVVEVEDLDETSRGEGGFGSTGDKHVAKQ